MAKYVKTIDPVPVPRVHVVELTDKEVVLLRHFIHGGLGVSRLAICQKIKDCSGSTWTERELLDFYEALQPIEARSWK